MGNGFKTIQKEAAVVYWGPGGDKEQQWKPQSGHSESRPRVRPGPSEYKQKTSKIQSLNS